MKITKNISKIMLAAACVLAASCASTKVDDATSPTPRETEVKADSEKKDSSEKNDKDTKSENESSSKSNYSAFLEKIEGLKIEVTETPKETTKLKAFLTPYAIKITKNANGIPLSNLKIKAHYPSSRNASTGEIIYADSVIQIDSSSETECSLDFLPPVPQCSANDKITFSPYFDENETDIEKFEKEAEKYAVEAEYKVRTNMKSAGGVVSILDFDKSGKAQKGGNLKSSSSLLMKIYGAGFKNVGNDDFSKEIAEGNEENIFNNAIRKYKDATFSFLIYGIYKYDTEVTAENPTDVSLIGEVNCLNLKATSENDRVLFRTTQKVTGKNLSAAIDELSKKISEEIIYGM
ncbi:MAG: hypothetical protein IKO57_00785 [Treponema sp.]|nr:hypothetical protein [Treponema sp.]